MEPFTIIIISLVIICILLFLYSRCACDNDRKHKRKYKKENYTLKNNIINLKSNPLFNLSNSTQIDNVQIPRDDGVVDEIVQWWYWTGHLTNSDNTLVLGYEICFFMVVNSGNLVQCAITHVTNNKFYFNEHLSSGKPDMTPNKFNLKADNGIALATGGSGRDHLEASAGPYKLIVDLEQTKSTTLHYGGDRHYFSFGGNTKYYSRSQMKTTGSITNINTNITQDVLGNTWFDRQYGGLIIAITKGWQWFAIGLDDGRDIMIYDFNGNIQNEANGSITDASGNSFEFSSFNISDIGSGWTSPNTKCIYPNIWQVQFPIDKNGTMGPKYIIIPEVANQELLVKYSPVYWEGTCNVYPQISDDIYASLNAIENGSVKAVGKSYTELNGYCSAHSSSVPPVNYIEPVYSYPFFKPLRDEIISSFSYFKSPVIHELDLFQKVVTILKSVGISNNALFAHSSCSDEIIHMPGKLINQFTNYFGASFKMGGLGGIYFGGQVSFNAYASHASDIDGGIANGDLFILYGPHVGISDTGVIGLVNRFNQKHESTCCGALIGGYNVACPNNKEFTDDQEIQYDTKVDIANIDPVLNDITIMREHEFEYIISSLRESGICEHDSSYRNNKQQLNADLASVYMYPIVEKSIVKSIDTSLRFTNLVLLGGVFINTSNGDYFEPKTFDFYKRNNDYDRSLTRKSLIDLL